MELIKLETEELKIIEKSKSEKIRQIFLPMANMLNEFENNFNEIIEDSKKEITSQLISKAKRLRLDIAKVRIETDKKRKEEKEEYLRAGKAIDGVSNIIKWAVVDKENKLKDIETYFERKEQERLEKIDAERQEEIKKYTDDIFPALYFANMQDDVWNAYLSAKKKEYNDRIEAEKKAEEDRIKKEKAEAEEQERIRKENEKLKKEAEERKKIEAERLKKEAEEKKKQEAKLRAEREEKERIQKEKEKIQREKEEQEARIKEEERKKAEEEERKIQEELKKGDNEKIKDLINDFIEIKTKYKFKSKKCKKIYSDVNELIDKVINFINLNSK